jgi:hypothetical protein
MTLQQIEALKLALSTLREVQSETFRLLRNGQRLYAEEKVWNTIIEIKETLAEHAMREVQRLGQEIEPKIGCVNHDCDQCKAQPERHELQAKGEHPAPCARHCEANAFQIVIKNLKAQLAQPEQEPVAWLLTDKNINALQAESIQRLIDRLKHAHHTDLRVRINGQDEWFEADWLKHMVRVTPPQRTWVGLNDDEIDYLIHLAYTGDEEFVQTIEAKLKEKNT